MNWNLLFLAFGFPRNLLSFVKMVRLFFSRERRVKSFSSLVR